MRLPSLILVGASLLATLPVTAQINDGRPDPAIVVPESLDLPYALGFALDNNFTIRQAKERIRQQEGIVLEVRSSQIPAVDATAGYARNDDEIGTNGRDHNWSVNITARQVLYAGGGVRASVAAQQLTLDAAVLSLRAVINDALLQVRTRFYTVLVNRERIKVQEQNIELLQRQLQGREEPLRGRHRVELRGAPRGGRPGQRPAGPSSPPAMTTASRSRSSGRCSASSTPAPRTWPRCPRSSARSSLLRSVSICAPPLIRHGSTGRISSALTKLASARRAKCHGPARRLPADDLRLWSLRLAHELHRLQQPVQRP
jgi:hypothetical protein